MSAPLSEYGANYYVLLGGGGSYLQTRRTPMKRNDEEIKPVVHVQIWKQDPSMSIPWGSLFAKIRIMPFILVKHHHACHYVETSCEFRLLIPTL